MPSSLSPHTKMRDIRLSKSCSTYSRGRRSYLSTPQPQPQPQPSGGKNLTHTAYQKGPAMSPTQATKQPSNQPPLTVPESATHAPSHPIPSHPIPHPPSPFPHSPNPTLSRTAPKNHEPPRTKGIFFQNKPSTFHAEKSPLNPESRGVYQGYTCTYPRSMHAFACVALPPAVSSTEPPRGGSVRALLRGALWGIMKAFGGAFVACGLSLQLRGAGVMRGSGISASDVNSAPRRRRRCRGRYGWGNSG